jgi:hypothetical protein
MPVVMGRPIRATVNRADELRDLPELCLGYPELLSARHVNSVQYALWLPHLRCLESS